MDFAVSWSPQVREDLHEIAAFIAKDSPRYASAVVEKILAAGRSLRFLPLRGRVVPRLGRPNWREIFVYEYRLIYVVGDQRVQIVAVIHGRRDFDAVESRVSE